MSAFQHANARVINWRLLFRDGIRFVAIKLTEGTYYANPYYASDARAARSAGLYVLPYVFANPRRSGGAAQATFAVTGSGYRRARTMPPISVDLENDPYATTGRAGNCYGLGVSRMVAWIAAFTRQASALTGAPPVIYTTANWWHQCTGNTARFRRDPLWLASYGVSVPAVPPSWQRWAFWQYTNSANLPGVGLTDLDYFRPGPFLASLGRPPVHRSSAHRRPAHRRAGHRRAAHRRAVHRKAVPRKAVLRRAVPRKVVHRKPPAVHRHGPPLSRKWPGVRKPPIVRTSAPVPRNRTRKPNPHRNHHVSPRSHRRR
jgi:GH25 family lysozyme M1 (1,4-beta-N-acetylmuramidase)